MKAYCVYVIEGLNDYDFAFRKRFREDWNTKFLTPYSIRINAFPWEVLWLRLEYRRLNKKKGKHIRIKRNRDLELIDQLEIDKKLIDEEIEEIRSRLT